MRAQLTPTVVPGVFENRAADDWRRPAVAPSGPLTHSMDCNLDPALSSGLVKLDPILD